MVTRRKQVVPTELRSTPPLKRRLPPIPTPPEVRSVAISGSYPDSLSAIIRTNASLHLVTGRLEGETDQPPERVLLPFAEFRLGGGTMEEVKDLTEDDDPPTLLSKSVSLENMAFMVLDLAQDLKRMCAEVSSIGRGSLSVDPQRMAHVRYFVAHLERQARSCKIGLDKAFGAPQADPDDE